VLSNGWKHGECIVRETNGCIIRRGLFMFNLLDKDVIRYYYEYDSDSEYDDTTIRETIEYKMGKKQMECTFNEIEEGHRTIRYYCGGKLYKRKDYDDTDDISCSIKYDHEERRISMKGYHPDENLVIKRRYKYDGEIIYTQVCEYVMDELVGDYSTITRDGVSKIEGPVMYIADWYSDCARVETCFVDGKMNGHTSVKIKDSVRSVIVSVNFYEGKFDGTIKIYHYNNLVFIGEYKKSKCRVISTSQRVNVPDLLSIFAHKFPGMSEEYDNQHIKDHVNDEYDLSKLLIDE
jgi:hypothetical protein